MLDVSLRKRLGDFTVDAAFALKGSGVTTLFGRSGAGKTSIIKMIAGLIKPDSGRVVLDGLILFDRQTGVEIPPFRRGIGSIFQDGRLFPHFTVRGNLLYGHHRSSPIDFDDVVGILGIAPLLNRRPARLSGGEKQRVAIGRALLASPKLLLMDEPLAALDGARKAELLPYIRQLSEHFHIPILYVSHSADEVLAISDHMVLLDEGRIDAMGPVQEVMARPEFAFAAGLRK